jgi:hypothetical protein
MSEFPELDKLAQEIEGGKPSAVSNSALLLIVLGIFIFAGLLFIMAVFFKTLSLI